MTKIIKRDEKLHEAIMEAFHKYFKAHQQWMTKGTRKAGMETRTCLSEIRNLAKEQRAVIMNWRYAVDSDKRLRKAQNLGTGEDESDN